MAMLYLDSSWAKAVMVRQIIAAIEKLHDVYLNCKAI